VGVSGTGTVPSVVLYEQGDVVFVATNSGNLTAVGYVFKGWGSTANATVPTYVVSGSTVNPPSFSMSASNITLYAVWQPIGGGEGFDGGTINSPLEIMCKFPSFANHDAVRNWMDSSSPPNPQDYTAYLRFTNKNPSPTLSTDIYGVAFKDGNNYVAGVGINDSLLVRKNLFAKKGGIDLLSVPIGLKVDWIENFTNDNDLTLKATVGQKIKLDGNVQITGTLTGGGGGGTFDGGNVHTPITIYDNYLKLYNYQTDADAAAISDPIYSWSVRDWLYGGDKINGVATLLPPGANVTPNIGLRLANNKPSAIDGNWWNNLHNIVVHGDANMNNPEGSPALGVTKQFFIRGDFVARGPLNSHEGIIVLHGNGINQNNMQPATPGNYKTGWHIGWGPRVGTPFVFLAEGGDFVHGQGGNPDAETLLIVTNRDPPNPQTDAPLPTLKSNAYKWGHFECGKITSHDIIHTNEIGPCVNNINPPPNYVKPNKIQSYVTIAPHPIKPDWVTTRDLGTPQQEWDNLYVKNLHVSGNSSINIRRGVAATNTTTGVVFVPLDFPAGTAPHVTATVKSYSSTPTQPNTDPIVISVYNVTNSGFYVRTMIVGTAEHKHKIGNVNATANNEGFSIQSDGNHSHSQINYSATSQAGPSTGQPNTGASHTHTTSMYPAASTNSGGSHTHGITKPAYVKEALLRNQSGGSVSLGGALASQSSSAQDLYSENAPTGSAALYGTVVKGVDLYWIAVI